MKPATEWNKPLESLYRVAPLAPPRFSTGRKLGLLLLSLAALLTLASLLMGSASSKGNDSDQVGATSAGKGPRVVVPSVHFEGY